MGGIKLSSEQVLAYVEASLRMEGLKLSDDARTVIQRVLKGEITYEEGRQELLTSARSGRYAQGDTFRAARNASGE